MIKIKIPYELIEPSKKDCPMTKLAYIIKETQALEINDKIDVTKIWVNSETEKKLDELFLKFIKKNCKTRFQQELSWYKLIVGPSCDVENSKNLETDYIYLEKDYIKE